MLFPELSSHSGFVQGAHPAGIPMWDEPKMASWGFWWKHRNFNSQRCCTVNESSFSPWSKHGNKVRGFSYPLWVSVNETQLGLFAWENSSKWAGRFSCLEPPDLFWCFFLPESGNHQGKQHSKGGVVIQGRCGSGVFTVLAG